MVYYRIYINSDNKVWRKYFTFDEKFIFNGKETKAVDFIMQKSVNNVKIQALGNGGNVINDELLFIKDKMPEFSSIERIFFIKEDIIDVNSFANLTGIKFVDIEVEGSFSKCYKLLTFDIAIDCIDENKTKRASFDFFSTLVLDSEKIPIHVDGFFLKNWNEYGKYTTIVNENLKNCLLKLPKVKDFFIFKEIDVAEK